MGMQGTVWKREGTKAFMYSRKGAWKYPMDIKGIDPLNVMVGHRYEMNDQGGLEHRGENGFFDKDLSEHQLPDLRSGAQETAPAAPGQPEAAKPSPGPGVRLDGLMASATGIAKSCLESGKYDADEAMRYGAAWAALWGEVPPGVKGFLVKEWAAGEGSVDQRAVQRVAEIQAKAQANRAISPAAQRDEEEDNEHIPF